MEFEATNTLEKALIEAQSGAIEPAEMLSVLKESVLFVPSGTEIRADLSGFTPLLYENELEGTAVSIFSSQLRLDPFKDKAKYHMQIPAIEFFRRFPPNIGVVINPGWKVGAVIDSATIARELKQ